METLTRTTVYLGLIALMITASVWASDRIVQSKAGEVIRHTPEDEELLDENDAVIAEKMPKTVDVYMDESGALTLQGEKQSVSFPLSKENMRNLPYIQEFENIGVIFFDGQDTRPSKLGQLYPLRRALKAKTWTIAISTTPCENLPFRTQLTLFEDDPVDLLLTPKPMPEAYALWPRTRFLAYPEKANPVRITPSRITLPTEEKP